MEEWKEYKASEFCESVTDGTHDSPKSKDKGFYLITSKHLKDSYIDFASAKFISREDYQKVIQRSKVEQYDVLFSMIGTIGNTLRVTSSKIEFAVKNMGIFKFGGNNLNSKWFYYWLKSPKAKEYIKSRLSGSTQSYLTLNSLRDFPVLCPDNKTKKDIISILSSLDDKIELNRRINENLEQQAQALFKSWFIDNKNNKLQYYELGDITLITAGGDKPSVYSKDLTEQCRIPIYSNGTENEGLYGYTTSAKINSASITISARGTIGYVCLRTEPYVPIVRLISVVPNIENLSAEYLYLWALTQNINGTGTTQQQLTVPNFRHTLIGIPTKEKMIRFNNIVSPIFQRIVINKNENRILSQLRDTLLPRLMSGELEIKDNSYD